VKELLQFVKTLALTLTLSPGEREQPSRASSFRMLSCSNPAIGLRETRRAFLPLLGGEGRREGGRKTILVLALFAFLLTTHAQPKPPHIGYVYPAGGRAGTTFELKVGGQFLDSVTNAFVTGEGMVAEVIDFHRPMPQGQFNKLRDRMQELRDKRQATRREDATNAWTTADQQELDDIRDQILKNPPNRNASPAIADIATVRVTIPTNAIPGDLELRLLARNGLSNPMKFCVGSLAEFTAPAARANNPEADRIRRQFNLPPLDVPQTNVARVTLPTVINGQIMPGEVDRYRFNARRGQQLVIAVSARQLIPYLADAVPGWFQATVALYDAKGKELAYDDDFQFHPDPVLHLTVPRDGEYFVEVKDSIYRGREDFVYRIALGELPFVTSAFPLGGRAGETTRIALAGWNLPTNQITAGPTATGITTLSLPGSDLLSAPIPFAAEDLPEVREREPNNTSATAQSVLLPVIANGRIDSPEDTDVFQIDGKAGDTIMAEVTARRLNSPLDSVLKICAASGEQLAFNDDCEDRACGLNTHHADSQLLFRVPSDGKYFVHLADTQRHGGPEYGYRLRLSAPRPDFELRAVPASLSVRPGDRVPVRLVALRKDGFTNEITIALKDAPTGFRVSGGRIATGTNESTLTLIAPLTRVRATFTLTLEGRARTDAGDIVHPVVPAEDMMQAFFYRHLVPAQELQVAIIGRDPQRPAAAAKKSVEAPSQTGQKPD
jgi:hypothetical protein